MRQRVALVTGTSRGLGLSIANKLISMGFFVYGCSRSGIVVIDGSNMYKHFIVDVSNEQRVKEMFQEIGQLDVVINSAGVASMNHSLLTSGETVDKIMAINFRGTFFVCREAGKKMRKTGGRIVNFTTVGVPLNLAGEAIYVASKAAVESLTKVLAKELAPITVNAVGPSPINTDLIAGVPSNKIEKLIDQLALKTMVTSEDVYNVIDFFIRPESSNITGQVIYLGGA